MKLRDGIATSEISMAFAIITFWPAPAWELASVMDWVNHLVRFIAFFVFVDGLHRFRNGISVEIGAKTGTGGK